MLGRLQERFSHSIILEISPTLFISVDPDALYHVQPLALGGGVLDGQVLDHAADLAPVVQGQLDPQALVFEFLEPSLFMIPGLTDIVRPVL